MIFNHYNYFEQRKIQLALFEFPNYANIWWDQLLKDRMRNGEWKVGDVEPDEDHNETAIYSLFVLAEVVQYVGASN